MLGVPVAREDEPLPFFFGAAEADGVFDSRGGFCLCASLNSILSDLHVDAEVDADTGGAVSEMRIQSVYYEKPF